MADKGNGRPKKVMAGSSGNTNSDSEDKKRGRNKRRPVRHRPRSSPR